jgi:hypothetical protein
MIFEEYYLHSAPKTEREGKSLQISLSSLNTFLFFVFALERKSFGSVPHLNKSCPF